MIASGDSKPISAASTKEYISSLHTQGHDKARSCQIVEFLAFMLFEVLSLGRHIQTNIRDCGVP